MKAILCAIVLMASFSIASAQDAVVESVGDCQTRVTSDLFGGVEAIRMASDGESYLVPESTTDGLIPANVIRVHRDDLENPTVECEVPFDFLFGVRQLEDDRVVGVGLDTVGGHGLYVCENGAMVQEIRLDNALFINDLAVVGDYAYVTDQALTGANFSPNPEFTKLIKVNLNNPSDRTDLLLNTHGFYAVNGITVNKNGDGLLIADFGGTLVGMVDLDLNLQIVVDVGNPTDGIVYADWLDSYVLTHPSTRRLSVLNAETLEVSSLMEDIYCAAAGVDSERQVLLCPSGYDTPSFIVIDLAGACSAVLLQIVNDCQVKVSSTLYNAVEALRISSDGTSYLAPEGDLLNGQSPSNVMRVPKDDLQNPQLECTVPFDIALGVREVNGRVIGIGNDAVNGNGIYVCENGVMTQEIRLDNTRFINDLAVVGDYVYVTDTAIDVATFETNPDLTKVMKINLNDPTDRTDLLLKDLGFLGVNGIGLNKNGDGVVVADFMDGTLVAFLDFDLNVQSIVDVRIPTDGIVYADWLDSYILSHPTTKQLSFLNAETLEVTVAPMEIECAAIDVNSEERTLLCPGGVFLSAFSIVSLTGECLSQVYESCLEYPTEEEQIECLKSEVLALEAQLVDVSTQYDQVLAEEAQAEATCAQAKEDIEAALGTCSTGSD